MLDNKDFSIHNRQVSIYPALLIAGDWLLLGFAIYLLSQELFILRMAGFILILRQQLAMSVMMHEGVHYSLAGNKKLNDTLGILFCSGPILSHFSAYRNLHMKHHRDALSSEDPGRYLLRSQNSLLNFLMDIALDLSSLTYFSLGKKAKIDKISIPVILMNLAGQVFGLTLVWGLFKLNHLSTTQFFLFWILPLITVHQLILRLRALMEHGGYIYNKDAVQCTRTVKAGLLTGFLAPHNINFHIEHHLYPTIPGYRLHKVSAKLDLKKENHYLSAAHSVVLAGLKK